MILSQSLRSQIHQMHVICCLVGLKAFKEPAPSQVEDEIRKLFRSEFEAFEAGTARAYQVTNLEVPSLS